MCLVSLDKRWLSSPANRNAQAGFSGLEPLAFNRLGEEDRLGE
jgi:hypothetical protein